MDWSWLIFPNITTFAGLCWASFTWAVVFVGLWVLFFSCLYFAGLQEIGDESRKTWALKLSMLVHHAFVGPLALVAIIQDRPIMEALQCLGCQEASFGLVQAGPLPESVEALMPITLGYMIAGLVLLPAWSLAKGSQVENVLMIMHHAFSLLVWPLTFIYNYCARYVLILLSYEVSSIFMTVIWLLRTGGKKNSSVYKVSGLLFTASFVLLRMFGAVPQLRALWYAPPWMSEVAEVSIGKGEKLATWQTASTFTLIIPHLLNWFWGVKVVRGFLQVARAQGREQPGAPLLESSVTAEE